MMNTLQSYVNFLDALGWEEKQRSVFSQLSSDQILNSDHCSFQQEYVRSRTLSLTGERTTEVAIRKKRSVADSYSLIYNISCGQLLGKFLLILQKKVNLVR